jgi:hypothetical protein
MGCEPSFQADDAGGLAFGGEEAVDAEAAAGTSGGARKGDELRPVGVRRGLGNMRDLIYERVDAGVLISRQETRVGTQK